MAELTLERLGRGIKAAHEANDKETVKKLGAAYRELQASQQQTSPEPKSGIGDVLTFGIDNAQRSVSRGIEDIGQLTGLESVEDFGRGQAEAQEEQIRERNYQRPEEYDGVVSNLKEGDFGGALGSLGYAAAESAPSVAAGAAASAGAGIAAVTSSPAIAAGGAAAAIGGSIYGTVDALGQNSVEAEEKGVDQEATFQDLGAAVASSAVELVPAGRGAGYVLKFTKEGLQEAGQEGIVIGNTYMKGGEYVPEEVANRMAEAGVVGGAISRGTEGTVRAAGKGIEAAGNIRTDKKNPQGQDFDDTDSRAAERLVRQADGDPSRLSNVSDTESLTSAQGTAKGARKGAVSDMQTDAKKLRKLAKKQQNNEAEKAIDRITKTGGDHTSGLSESDISIIEEAFGDLEEGQSFISNARQAARLERFVKPTGDMGGLSRKTRYFDFLDDRNSGLTRVAAGAGSLAGGYAGTMALGAVGIGANRAARGLDNLTNNRSRVKRYVDSVNKAQAKQADRPTRTTQDVLNEFKAREDAEKLQDKERKKANNALIKRLSSPARIHKPGKAPKDRQASQENIDRYTPQSRAVEDIFDQGAPIPKNDPMYEGYRRWEDRTGLSPQDTLDTLEQLERDGEVPQDTARRYREDIGSFSGKKNRNDTIAIQEIVRKRANPDHEYTRPGNPEEALRKLDNRSVGVTGNRRKHKAMRGEQARNNVDANIQNASATLTTPQYKGLLDLAATVDQANMTRDDRDRAVNKSLGNIFRGNKELADLWKRQFAPLTSIGNDYAIERQEAANDPNEQFEKKNKKVKAKSAKKKKKKSRPSDDVATPSRTEDETDPQQTPEDRALEKLATKAPDSKPVTPDTGTQRREAKELTATKKAKKPDGRNSLANMVHDRVDHFKLALNAVQSGETKQLQDFYSGLNKSSHDRVVRMMIESASDQTTQNMLSETYSNQLGIPYNEAAQIVDKAMADLESDGLIKRYNRKGASTLMEDGSAVRDADGRKLSVVSYDLVEPNLQNMLELSKAEAAVKKMIDPQGPSKPYTPDNLQDGPHRALKSYSNEEVDASFAPIFNFLNPLRQQHLSYNNDILTQLEGKLEGKNDQLGTIAKVLMPDGDKANVHTLGQILFNVGGSANRTDTRFRQEWFADKNMRVYPKNGMAHTQAGDLMKGLTRLPERRLLGGEQGLKSTFHGISNLLGFDKESVEFRDNYLTRNPKVVNNLVKFADDPLAQGKLGRMVKGEWKPSKIGEMVENGEGFFQVLNAAHEVRRMANFAKERFPDRSQKDAGKLLADPEVQADLAENYSTDFIAQYDASNNAYQLMGLATGDMDILRATGMQPQEGAENPYAQKGADIYLDPARDIAGRIPELTELGLPESKLRKLFKNPIGTFLYEAEYNSRKDSFKKSFGEVLQGAPIFRLPGQEDGHLELSPEFVQGMESEEGRVVERDAYDQFGETKEQTKRERKRVRPSDNGRWRIESAAPNGKKWRKGRNFDTKEEAIKAVAEDDLLVRMNSELLRDMNIRYPAIREYLSFAGAVTRIAKERGEDHVKIPTPDGMLLKSRFKDQTEYEGLDVEVGGRTVPMGVKTDRSKKTGRGVAAAMMHQLDAYVLRETHRRMKEQGLLQDGFNPIHDSYGFHPSEAEAGTKVWAEVMQELGQENYNIFHQLLEANGIKMGELRDAKGVIPKRQPVQPVPQDQIPTALS